MFVCRKVVGDFKFKRLRDILLSAMLGACVAGLQNAGLEDRQAAPILPHLMHHLFPHLDPDLSPELNLNNGNDPNTNTTRSPGHEGPWP